MEWCLVHSAACCMPRCMVQVGLPASLLQMVFLEGSVIIKLFIEGACVCARARALVCVYACVSTRARS